MSNIIVVNRTIIMHFLSIKKPIPLNIEAISYIIQINDRTPI